MSDIKYLSGACETLTFAGSVAHYLLRHEISFKYHVDLNCYHTFMVVKKHEQDLHKAFLSAREEV